MKEDKKPNYKTLRIDGIDVSDLPDLCDAYASYCEWDDGSEMTDEELEAIDPQIIYEEAMNSLF